MKIRFLMSAALLAALSMSHLTAQAQSAAPTPAQLLQRMARPGQSGSFEAVRKLTVRRVGSGDTNATARVAYADGANHALTFTAPEALAGMRFDIRKGVASLTPGNAKEQLVNFAFDLPASLMLGTFSSRRDLLSQNYYIQTAPSGPLLNRATIFVELTPKNLTRDANGTTVPLTPRRRLWLDQSTLQVLREERYWDGITAEGQWALNQEPYCVLAYESFKPAAAGMSVSAAAAKKRIAIAGKSPGTALGYHTVAEAEQAEKLRIGEPSLLPAGFALTGVQVLTVNDLRAQVLSYSDGLNQLSLLMLPNFDQLSFLFGGGELSPELMQQLAEFSVLAPYNYYNAWAGETYVVAFGDVTPVELERTAKSLRF